MRSTESPVTRCSIEGCDRPFFAKGWCSPHYQRALRHGGDPTAGRPDRRSVPHAAKATCSELGCQKLAKARGLCGAHYFQARKAGRLADHKPMRPPRLECSVAECTAQRYGHGLCQTHFARAKRNGTLDQYSRADEVSTEPQTLGKRRHPVCTEDGCEEPHLAMGFCMKHYYRDRYRRLRAQRPRKPTKPKTPRQPRRTCSIDGCENRHVGHGLCHNHLEQKRRADAPRCLGPDCNRRQIDHGLCRVHLTKVRRLDVLEDWDEMRATLLAAQTGDHL